MSFFFCINTLRFVGLLLILIGARTRRLPSCVSILRSIRFLFLFCLREVYFDRQSVWFLLLFCCCLRVNEESPSLRRGCESILYSKNNLRCEPCKQWKLTSATGTRRRTRSAAVATTRTTSVTSSNGVSEGNSEDANSADSGTNCVYTFGRQYGEKLEKRAVPILARPVWQRCIIGQ